jgi:tetratricopeptide (TPR) repeat protein
MGYPESFNEIDRWYQEMRQTHFGEDMVHALEKRIEAEANDERLRILNWFLYDEYKAQGNEAAAHAVRCRDPEMEIHDWHYEWIKNPPEIDIIPVLEDRIRGETHPSRLHALRFHLASAHATRGNYAAAEAVFQADFEADPENPQPLIFLAGQKLREEEQPAAAMRIIERAVEVALRVGMWRRHALGEKARAALALDRPAVVEEVLRQLLALTFTRGNADCEVERDFLDRLPPGSVDPDVAQAYDDYCRERGVLPKALEQQIDDLILSSASAEWRKVAEITSDVLSACARNKLEIGEYAIWKRVRYLAGHDELQAKGALRRPRDSEVKLPE